MSTAVKVDAQTEREGVAQADARPLRNAGLVLGIGIGGLADGIVLHQLLQWHHFICPGGDCHPTDSSVMEHVIQADGLFNLAMWLITLIGLVLLFRAGKQRMAMWSGQLLAGALIVGWGFINLLDSVINHYLLQTHHVRQGPDQGYYDLLFLVLSVVLMVGGGFVARSATRARHGAPG